MTAAEYHDYLQSPEWITRSAAAKKRAGRKCQICAAKTVLQTHHNTYERLGAEEPEDLFCVCDECHELISHHVRKHAPAAVCEWPRYLQKVYEEESRPKARMLAALLAAQKMAKEESDGIGSNAPEEDHAEQVGTRPLVRHVASGLHMVPTVPRPGGESQW